MWIGACGTVHARDADGGAGVDSATPSDGAPDAASTCDGCPDPPRLRFPPNGHYTGSVFASAALTPRFRWLPVAGADRYELQVDDDCPVGGFAGCDFSDPEVDEVDLTATEHQVASALPVSTDAPVGRRYYWRVRACNQAGCSPYSVVRYLLVGRQRADLNGDGYGDVIAGGRHLDGAGTDDGAVSIWFGRPIWAAALGTDDTTVVSPLGQTGGRFARVRAIGDVNGDGFGDLAVGATYQDDPEQDEGGLYIYYGRASWPATLGVADVTIDCPIDLASALFGTSAGGDVNGDGYADLAVEAPYADIFSTNNLGQMFVYFGGPSLPARLDSADVTIDPPVKAASLAFRLHDVGDLNGDEFADIVIGSSGVSNPESSEGNAFIYLGRASWPQSITAADVVVDHPLDLAGGSFATGSEICDLDGDDLQDLLVSDGSGSYKGQLHVFYGRESWASVVASDDVTFDIDAPAGSQFAARPAICRDFDGDGDNDVVVGAVDHSSPESKEGGAFLFLGRASWPGVVASADAFFDHPLDQSTGAFASTVASAGDVNGDAIDDLLVGAISTSNPETNEGAVYLYLGRASWAAQLNGADVAIDNPSDLESSGFPDSLD